MKFPDRGSKRDGERGGERVAQNKSEPSNRDYSLHFLICFIVVESLPRFLFKCPEMLGREGFTFLNSIYPWFKGKKVPGVNVLSF